MLTPYGRIRERGSELEISATRDQIREWAHRPGHRWPCSTLECARRVVARFGSRGDLVELLHPGTPDVDAHELTAWAADVRQWRADILATCTPTPEGGTA